MEVIILAGGKGTRLQSLVSDVPKPMAPVNNRPFLEIILDSLVTQNVSTCVLSVGYKHHIIREYFGDFYKGITLKYAVEEAPLGTGGGIALAMQQCISENVFVINGDTYFPVPLESLKHMMEETSADIVIALKNMTDFDRYGSVELGKNNRVIRFIEKRKCADGYINGGIYLVKNDIFKTINKEIFSFENFLNEKIISLCIHGILSEYPFIDIGIPEDYHAAKLLLKTNK